MRNPVTLVTATIWLAFASMLPGSAKVEIVDAWYRADQAFPEFNELWMDVSNKEAAELGRHAGPQPLAGSVHVYVRNTGSSPVAIEDVVVEGISLKRAIAPTKSTDKDIAGAASVYFSDLSADERAVFRKAGAPIWWKADPNPIAPGGFAEVTVRLRTAPEVSAPKVEMRLADGSSCKMEVRAEDNRPRIVGICFSPTLDLVHVYVTRPSGVTEAPAKLLIDGDDVTARSEIGHDPKLGMNVISTKLEPPVGRASFHLFQCVYPMCGTASAAVRAWDDEPAYGIWGARPAKADEVQVARDYLQDIADHNINVQMEMIGSEGVADLLKSEEGQKLMESLGIRRMISEPGKGRTKRPYAYFLQDEPDAKDFFVKGIPAHERVGSMIPSLVREANDYRRVDPLTPNLVNVDMTFKPNNYHVYGQLTDIFATDPYYLPRIFQSFNEHPSKTSLYLKATFLLASATVAESACAPKPLHMILFSTRGGRVKRFPTAVEKRIEAYYSLGVGAKGLSYWWYTPAQKAQGCGTDDPEAKALWKEIGLIGAEFGTLGSLINLSCPVELPISASPNLWVRSLVVGQDSLVVLFVNDNYACDRLGTGISAVADARATLTLPKWLTCADAFEVRSTGIGGVKWAVQDGRLDLALGTVDVTRAIVVTSDSSLRGRLQSVYAARFAGNVMKLESQHP